MVLSAKMHSQVWSLFALLLLFVQFTNAQEYLTPNRLELKAIKKFLCEDPITKPVIIPKQMASSIDYYSPNDYVFSVFDSDKLIGYVLSTSAKGRYDDFDYCVVYSDGLVVKGVVVTVYRSTHGTAICQRKWLSQFIGYKGGELKIGSEIDGVSGGTISAISITEDIQRSQKMIVDLITGNSAE
jgi:hypothetical protein